MNYMTISERAEKKLGAAAVWRARSHQAVTAVDVEAVTLEVCAKHGVSRSAVHSPDRRHNVVACRNEIFYLVHKAGWSFPMIGGYFGKDHSSVLHGVRRHEGQLHLSPVSVEITEASPAPVSIAVQTGFKIEKGVPLLPVYYGKSGRPAKYPFGAMAVGDSFLANGVAKKKIFPAASYYGKRNGLTFSIRKDGEWYRVWRTA